VIYREVIGKEGPTMKIDQLASMAITLLLSSLGWLIGY